MPLGIKPTVDFVFKKTFGSPENAQALIGLLNAILDLPHPIADVTILNPFNYQEFAEAKQIVLDVRARDAVGRLLNIEMQVSVVTGMIERLTYYACSMFTDQLKSGGSYTSLQPAISICLLPHILFRDSEQAHHRFQLVDKRSGRELDRGVEVHTVELMKYNLDSQTIRMASKIEQWAFFLSYADQYEPKQLRELLPGIEFDRAISVIETIAAKTEDRVMYNAREKAQRDYEWALESAREDGRIEGVQQGMQRGEERGEERGKKCGALAGKIQLLQQLLGESPSDLEELCSLPTDELSDRLTDLQQRLRSRDS